MCSKHHPVPGAAARAGPRGQADELRRTEYERLHQREAAQFLLAFCPRHRAAGADMAEPGKEDQESAIGPLRDEALNSVTRSYSAGCSSSGARGAAWLKSTLA